VAIWTAASRTGARAYDPAAPAMPATATALHRSAYPAPPPSSTPWNCASPGLFLNNKEATRRCYTAPSRSVPRATQN
jgi:hypothetical protein